MDAAEAKRLAEAQRALFSTGATLELEHRRRALGALYDAVRGHEAEISAALRADLGKGAAESYMCETGLLLRDISCLRRRLGALAGPKRRSVGLAQFPGYGELRPMPYGVVLIMGAWNYPLLLTLQPLAAAIAAGNCAVIKPSSGAPETARVISELLGGIFTPDFVACTPGGRGEHAALLEARWDKIFFTGGAAAGREVLRAAAESLTPVALELGGKCPVIVEASADIPLAARRIVAGKLLNCGQTCVAPDYVLCDTAVEEALLGALRRELERQYPSALDDPEYPRMASRAHFERVRALIDPVKAVCGGRWDEASLKIEPTVLRGVQPGDAVMAEEIFGPVLPVLTYKSLGEALAFVEGRPRPLALYLFTRSRKAKRAVLGRCRFGGGCVNDTVMHLTAASLPFGGVGESGMGAYHGRWGFEEFSHLEGILHRGGALEPPVRYRPWTPLKQAVMRRLLR